MKTQVAGLILAAIALSLAGCKQQPAKLPQELIPVALAGNKEAAGGDQVVTFDQVLQKHRGKVVLVDFWATWCDPCRELFPHTVSLQKQLSEKGLAVVTVSLDDPGDVAQVREFLDGQHAATENFIARRGGSSYAFGAFQIDGGAIPHLKLFDRTGKLRQKFTGGGHEQSIDRAVQSLVDET